MALKLPKSFHPDFARPGVKPAGSVEIDWSNPLSYKLRFACLYNSQHGFVDLLTGLAPSGQIVNAAGFNANHFWSDGGNNYLNYASKSGGNVTVSARLFPTYNNGATIITTKPTYQHTDGFTVFATNVNESPRISVTQGGFSRHFITIGPHKSRGKYLIDIVVRLVNGNTHLYQDGELYASLSGATPITSTELPISTLASAEEATINLKSLEAEVYHTFLFDDLTDAECRSINKDPYQILRPAQPMMLFQSAGGGGPSIIDILNSEMSFVSFLAESFISSIIDTVPVDSHVPLLIDQSSMTQVVAAGNEALNTPLVFGSSDFTSSIPVTSFNATVSVTLDSHALDQDDYRLFLIDLMMQTQMGVLEMWAAGIVGDEALAHSDLRYVKAFANNANILSVLDQSAIGLLVNAGSYGMSVGTTLNSTSITSVIGASNESLSVAFSLDVSGIVNDSFFNSDSFVALTTVESHAVSLTVDVVSSDGQVATFLDVHDMTSLLTMLNDSAAVQTILEQSGTDIISFMASASLAVATALESQASNLALAVDSNGLVSASTLDASGFVRAIACSSTDLASLSIIDSPPLDITHNLASSELRIATFLDGNNISRATNVLHSDMLIQPLFDSSMIGRLIGVWSHDGQVTFSMEQASFQVTSFIDIDGGTIQVYSLTPSYHIESLTIDYSLED